MSERYDVVVIGSGPNGLVAAVELARHDLRVLVIEGRDSIGGGTRTEELLLAGHLHDVCSAVHPLGIGSPVLRGLPLDEYGLRWVHPPIPLAHPLDGGAAAVLHARLDATAAGLGTDGPTYRRLIAPLAGRFDDITDYALGPMLRLPRHPMTLARFGLTAALPATVAARRFQTVAGRALLAGNAAHSTAPLSTPFTTAVGLMLMLAGHEHGWPVAAGGSAAITTALASLLEDLGGQIQTGTWVRSLDEMPPARAVVADVMPGALARMAGNRMPVRARRRAERWKHGPGSFKVDWVLDGPVPWSAQEVGGAGTVHVGGTLEEIAAAEATVWAGEHPERPFVLAAQPSVADPSRAPDGRHVLWGYTHVPHDSTVDMTERIEAQIERFAPGFRDRIIARHTIDPSGFEARNPNDVGGDIAGGAFSPFRLIARPRLALDPYRTAVDGVWLCSAATPPGAGVHGMGGHHAARSVLRAFGIKPGGPDA